MIWMRGCVGRVYIGRDVGEGGIHAQRGQEAQVVAALLGKETQKIYSLYFCIGIQIGISIHVGDVLR